MSQTENAAAPSPASAPFRVERVTLPSDGATLVGLLYSPDGVDADHAAPGVVVTGAWMTVKEQMAGRYARELAARGLVALAFDFRSWGESGGPTRSLENPTMKIADIEAAADYLASRPEVSSVNGLGVCASAGYMAEAAERSDRLSRLALVAPWLHDRAIVNAVYGGPEGVAGLIAIGRAAEKREAETGSPQLVPAAGPEGSDAVMAGVPYYTETERGLVPEWDNTFNPASWEGWLTFDGVVTAAGIRQPVLIVHSEDAAIPEGAHRFFADLKGEKRELWLDGVSQFDFYDSAEPVTAAADAVAAHLKAAG